MHFVEKSKLGKRLALLFLVSVMIFSVLSFIGCKVIEQSDVNSVAYINKENLTKSLKEYVAVITDESNKTFLKTSLKDYLQNYLCCLDEFVFSSMSKVEIPSENNKNIVYGSAGRLFIPSISCDVALNKAHLGETGPEDNNTQYYCDLEDSAAIYSYKEQTVIADHSDQEFNGLKSVVVGDKAYIYHSDNSYESLECVWAGYGNNEFVDWGLTRNGVCVGDENPGGIAMYTCNGDTYNIILTYWKYI